MVGAPLTIKAKALGFHALADLQMLGLEYQQTGLAKTQALIKPRPDLVRNIMKAYVEAGDMLSHPALRHYGDAFKWEKIYAANKERMKNPDYIYIGQTIMIPLDRKS